MSMLAQVYSPKTVNFHKIPDHLLIEFGLSPVEGLNILFLKNYKKKTRNLHIKINNNKIN